VVLIRALINERNKQGSKTEFEWIKGHSNDPSNEAADQLAVAGARMTRY
jgi:ribonuclease HI